MAKKKNALLQDLSDQNKAGGNGTLSLAKIKQAKEESKREEVKKRRNEENQKREKLKYWHLVKRDVLKHKKDIATNEANYKIRQARRMTKWVQIS